MFFTITISTMIILLAVSAGILLYANKDNNNYVFIDDYKIVLAVIVGVTILASVIGHFIGSSGMYYNEIWHYKGQSIKYEMPWTTEETEYYQVKVGTRQEKGADGKYHTVDVYETRHKHYTAHHGPNYYLYDEYNSGRGIDAGEYNKWKNIWRNEKQTGMNRGSAANFDRSIDGPILECYWDGKFETIYPISTIHSYKNKVRASKSSVLKLGQVTPELKKKYPRPADQKDSYPVLNHGGVTNISGEDRLLLDRTNAYLGRSFEIHCMFVIFNAADTGMAVVNDVLTAWQGTNKNELVIFAGTDPVTGNVTWVKCESWMDNTELYGYIDQTMLGRKFDAKMCSAMLKEYVPKYWKRKHFADFDYLNIEMPTWIICTISILQIISAVVVMFLTVSGVQTRRRYV